MTVLQCVDAPDDGPAHGTKRWHVIVTVTITVTILACAGVSPGWLSGAAAALSALPGVIRRD